MLKLQSPLNYIQSSKSVIIKKILPGDKLMMVEDLDWHQRATAQPRAFLDKYKQWEASGNRKIASYGLLVLKQIFSELVALKL